MTARAAHSTAQTSTTADTTAAATTSVVRGATPAPTPLRAATGTGSTPATQPRGRVGGGASGREDAGEPAPCTSSSGVTPTCRAGRYDEERNSQPSGLPAASSSSAGSRSSAP